MRLFLRSIWICLVMLGTMVSYLARRLVAGMLTRDALERLRGRSLASMLERLGATFIKFGQILSTRPDLLGPGYVEELKRLQDQVPPAPFSEVERVVAEDLDDDVRQDIASIEPAPLAAASVAQVHRARLRDGTWIALKVQRMRAGKQIDQDLILLSLGAKLLNRIPSVRLLSLPGSVDEFAKAMRAQLDFELEAANNRRFAKNFATMEGVDVPELFPRFCSRRVLAMELIEGAKATDLEAIGSNRKALAQHGLAAILQMVFHDGFVHADLHPGNILLTPDGGVVLIDLGLVAEIPDELLAPWVQTFAALAQQDGKAAARLFYGYAPSVGTKDYASFEQGVVDYFASIDGFRLGEAEASVVIAGMMNVLRRHHVQVDSIFTVVNIAMLVAEGLGKQLDPSLDLMAMAMPHLVEAQMRAPKAKPPLRTPPVS